MKEYGVGVVLYFQFLKFLAALFFLLTVLSVPSMYLCFKSNPIAAAGPEELVALLSLGNLGATKITCNTGTYLEPLAPESVFDYDAQIFM